MKIGKGLILSVIMVSLSAAVIGCGSRPLPGGEANGVNPQEDLDVNSSAQVAPHTASSNEGQIVNYECEKGRIQVTIPETWKYSIDEYDENQDRFSVSFHPEDGKDGEITIFYSQSFGVCGTGLETEVCEIGGMPATKGIYDGHSYWDYINFIGEYQVYTITNTGDEEWWSQYGEEVDQIFTSLYLGPQQTDSLDSNEPISTGAVKGDLVTGLLKQASPETSALTLYYYDGNEVEVRTLFDNSKTTQILSQLNQLQGKKTDTAPLADWNLPCYGLNICSSDGMDLCVAYSAGVWLNQAGEVFELEADFDSIWKQSEGADSYKSSVLIFPNAASLADHDQRFLVKADTVNEAYSFPKGVTLTVTDLEEGKLTVRIENKSGDEITYGEYYALEKEIQGSWYRLPIRATNVGFNDLAHILADSKETEETYHLSIYGELGEGNYRIVIEGNEASFSLNEKGELVK